MTNAKDQVAKNLKTQKHSSKSKMTKILIGPDLNQPNIAIPNLTYYFFYMTKVFDIIFAVLLFAAFSSFGTFTISI